MSETSIERLRRIGGTHELADKLYMNNRNDGGWLEIVKNLFETDQTDWLIERAHAAEKLEIEKERAEELLLKIYSHLGTSAEKDIHLWKETEKHFGGREKARELLEESK